MSRLRYRILLLGQGNGFLLDTSDKIPFKRYSLNCLVKRISCSKTTIEIQKRPSYWLNFDINSCSSVRTGRLSRTASKRFMSAIFNFRCWKELLEIGNQKCFRWGMRIHSRLIIWFNKALKEFDWRFLRRLPQTRWTCSWCGSMECVVDIQTLGNLELLTRIRRRVRAFLPICRSKRITWTLKVIDCLLGGKYIFDDHMERFAYTLSSIKVPVSSVTTPKPYFFVFPLA